MSLVMMRTAGLSVAALLVVGTGVALTRAGWPFRTGVLTIHKLVALAALVYTGVLAYGIGHAGQFTSTGWALLVTATALSVAVFASGAVISALESAPAGVVWVHRVGSWIAVLAVAALARLVV